MRIPWKRIARGLKVALDIAIDLNDAKLIRVKELDRVKTIKEVVEKRTKKKPEAATPVV